MRFDYGKDGLEFNLDPSWNVDIVTPKHQDLIQNPVDCIREKIRNPIQCSSLEEIVKKKISSNGICIVVSDTTRPVPSHLILEALIKELNDYGIKNSLIKILIATGLHRPSRQDEIDRIIGKVVKNYNLNIINHVATDNNSLHHLGELSNSKPIYINKHFCEADIKILTGDVEPHFFFGFSGGRKSLVPGIAGEETIQGNHSAENIDDSFSRFGFYKDNQMHKESLEIAKRVGIDFIVNVCINEKHEITQVAAGDLEKVHECLVDFQLNKVFKKISDPYDIVVAGNGGYPLDQNLYQAVKSMAIGEMGVKEGGTIISVNECEDGIGVGQERFKELLFLGESPEKIYEKVLQKEIVVPDQWEIQVLARILMKADVYVISTLKEEELGNIGLKYANTIEEAIRSGLEKHGKDARILILPNGPQILPLLR